MEAKKVVTLAEIAKRIRLYMRDQSVQAAIEVIRVRDNWDRYEDQADGLTFTQWLKAVHPTRSVKWFVARYEQFQRHKRLKSGFVRMVDGPALYWMSGATDQELINSKFKLLLAWKANGAEIALNLNQVRRICPHLSREASQRETLSDKLMEARERIKRLEAQIRKLGAEPVE